MELKTTRQYQKYMSLVATGKVEEASTLLSTIFAAKAKKLLSENQHNRGIDASQLKNLALILQLPIVDVDVDITEVSLDFIMICGKDATGNDLEVSFNWSQRGFEVDGNWLAPDGDGWNLPHTGGYFEDAGISKLGMPEDITIGFPDDTTDALKARLADTLKSDPRVLELLKGIINDYGDHNESFQAILTKKRDSNRVEDPGDY